MGVGAVLFFPVFDYDEVARNVPCVAVNLLAVYPAVHVEAAYFYNGADGDCKQVFSVAEVAFKFLRVPGKGLRYRP